MNELTTTAPAEQFRAKAANLLILAANMSLHQLVDEFQSLTTVMDENLTDTDEGGYPQLNAIGQLAKRERNIIVGTAKARFGIFFDSYDRPCDPVQAAW